MNPTERTEEQVRLGLGELFPEPTAVDLLPPVAAHMRRRRRWQRSGLFTAGLATVAAVAAAIMLVVGGGGAGTGSSGDQESYCAAVLVWHGHTYAGDGLSSANHPRQVGLVPARRMTSLGQFRQPACGDTGASGAGSTAAVERIFRVSPQAVVAGSTAPPTCASRPIRGLRPSGPRRRRAGWPPSAGSSGSRRRSPLQRRGPSKCRGKTAGLPSSPRASPRPGYGSGLRPR